MKLQALQEPPANHGCFGDAVVVEDKMHIPLGWDLGLNGIKKLPTLTGSLALMEFSDHLPSLHIQGGK